MARCRSPRSGRRRAGSASSRSSVERASASAATKEIPRIERTRSIRRWYGRFRPYDTQRPSTQRRGAARVERRARRELGEQPALADPGLADDERDPPAPAAHDIEAVE